MGYTAHYLVTRIVIGNTFEWQSWRAADNWSVFLHGLDCIWLNADGFISFVDCEVVKKEKGSGCALIFQGRVKLPDPESVLSQSDQTELLFNDQNWACSVITPDQDSLT